MATHAPWAWPLFRNSVGRFFDRMATGWDERIQPDSPEHLAALAEGLEHVEAPPARVLDVGTGTGAAALMLAERYPQAEVSGIDLSEQMIGHAKRKAEQRNSKVRFEVADVATYDGAGAYDLIVMVNMPPFYGAIANLLAPGGHVLHVSTAGARTPFYTSLKELRRAFARRHVAQALTGTAGNATYYVGRKTRT